MSIIYNRQSVRKFNAKGIERGELIKLIEAGITASSSNNKQPWQFIVLNSKELIEEFSKAHPSRGIN